MDNMTVSRCLTVAMKRLAKGREASCQHEGRSKSLGHHHLPVAKKAKFLERASALGQLLVSARVAALWGSI